MRSRDLKLSGVVVSERSCPDAGTPVRVRDGSTLELPAVYHPLRSLLGCVVNPDQPIS